MGLEFEIKPVYINQVSFNGKAKIKIDVEHKMLYLMSYGISVASYSFETQNLVVFDLYSKTTTKHIKEFIYLITEEECTTEDIRNKYLRKKKCCNETNR